MKIENKLGIGTVQFGLDYGISNKKGKTSLEEVGKIFRYANDKAIDVLDTAAAYGNAEKTLGGFNLQPFNIVSKYRPAADGISIADQLNNSLNDLNISQLYGYLAHDPKGLITSPEEWDQLKLFKDKGKIKKIGYSLNEPQELETLLKLECIPDLVQLPYNYFDRRFEADFERLKKMGCEIHTRSAFFQGLFFVDVNELSEFFEPIKSDLSQLQNHRAFSSGSLLKFVIDHPSIDKVIVGVENEQQLKDNLIKVKVSESLPKYDRIIESKILIPSKWPKKN